MLARAPARRTLRMRARPVRSAARPAPPAPPGNNASRHRPSGFLRKTFYSNTRFSTESFRWDVSATELRRIGCQGIALNKLVPRLILGSS